MGVGGVAQAHIILVSDGGVDTAKDFQVSDTSGNPQKITPCGGPGTATNAVLTVHAGDSVSFTWTEVVPHSGHFRIALVPVSPGEADGGTEPADGAVGGGVLPDPGTTATVEGDPTEAVTVLIHPSGATFGSGGGTVLADNLFPHCIPGDPCDAGPVSGVVKNYSYTVTIPNTPCTNCTLQLLQFMAYHGPDPSFFYHHCATVTILPAMGADGGVLPEDASVGSSGSGNTGSSTTGGGSSGGNGVPVTGGGSSGGAGSSSSNGTPNNGTANNGPGSTNESNASSSETPSSHNGGCDMAAGAASVPAALMALTVTLARRRRARKSRPSAP